LLVRTKDDLIADLRYSYRLVHNPFTTAQLGNVFCYNTAKSTVYSICLTVD